MKKLNKKLTAIFVVFAILITNAFAATNTELVNDAINSSPEMKNFEYIISITGMDYFFDNADSDYLRGALAEILKNHPELFEEALQGAYSVLDPNTRYVKSTEFADVLENVEGAYVGIGTTITICQFSCGGGRHPGNRHTCKC